MISYKKPYGRLPGNMRPCKLKLKIMSDPKNQEDLDNHANQLNPNNDAYNGGDDSDQRNDDHDYDNDNRSNQLNPNNDEYRG
jgi:hypothetical protein